MHGFFGKTEILRKSFLTLTGALKVLCEDIIKMVYCREMFSIENGKREGPTSLFDSTGKYVDDIYYEEGILVVDKIVLDSGPKEEEIKTKEVVAVNPPTKQKKKKQNNDDPLPPVIEEEKNYEDDPAFYKTVEVNAGTIWRNGSSL